MQRKLSGTIVALIVVSFVTLALRPALASVGTVVTSNPLWTDTGRTINIGDTVSITATGTWTWADWYGAWFGPDGESGTAGSPTGSYDYFLYGANHAELIAFVGPDPYQGHWGDYNFWPQTTGYWAVGSSGSFVSDKAGELWLGINDDAATMDVGNNSGAVTASITVMSVTPVIPEVPFGTVVASLSMIVALVGFVGFRRFRLKLQLQ